MPGEGFEGSEVQSMRSPAHRVSPSAFAILQKFVLTLFAFAEVGRRVWCSQKSLRVPANLGTPMALPLNLPNMLVRKVRSGT